MGDKKYTVRRGSRVKLELPARESADTAAPEERRRSLTPEDSDTTRYVFRDAPRVIFLDLGTRLRSVPAAEWKGDRLRRADETASPAPRDDYFDEYVEMEYERAAPAPLAAPTVEEVRALDLHLLGSRAPGSSDALDPLGTTPANVSARDLFNCMPLLHDSFFLFVTAGAGDETFLLIAEDTLLNDRELQAPKEWVRRKGASADADERWNGLNVSADVPFGSGVLKLKRAPARLRCVHGEEYGPGLRAVGAYEDFDTADEENFKITSEPSFDSAEVPLRLSGSALIRVYLKPRFHRRELQTLASTEPFRWDGRVSVYPDLWLLRNADEETFRRRAMCEVRRSPLAFAYYDSHPPVAGGFAPQVVWPSFSDCPSTLAPAGALAAVIAQGRARVYYVWRKTPRVLDTHDINPFVGGAVLDVPCS